MPDDVGGRPPDGRDPEDWDNRGGADEDYAAVVFDEDFVRSAPVHEPTAVERLLAAAQARAEAESARARAGGGHGDEDFCEDGYDSGLTYEPDDVGDDASPYGPHGGALRPYRGSARWHRPVAWLLALLMGVGMVALAFSAVYRGATANRQDRITPPATTGVDKPNPHPAPPAAPALHAPPALLTPSAEPARPEYAAPPASPGSRARTP